MATVSTGADGTAVAQLPAQTYTILIDNILGETYIAADCVLSPESPVLSVQLLALPAEGVEIYAYAPSADDDLAYQAAALDEGLY